MVPPDPDRGTTPHGALPPAAGTADSHAVRYRPDIDGLRALAVLSVIAYHVYAPGAPSGFLGVDMFFVLSGFLITSIIWREAQLHEFSVRKFYERRIRRILPALMVVLCATTVVAAVLLLPADLIGYGKSLAATIGFSANFYFWRDTDYFARAAAYKPLLHMWSLGVEEQFYIFFPLLLAFLVRFPAKVALLVTCAIVAVSFSANVFLVYADDAPPAFFLLPGRAWELGLGAALALLPPHVMPRRSAAALALAAVTMIAAGIFMPAPPLSFLPAGTLVVIGTALLIFTGRSKNPTVVNRFLALRPIVFIGLISYSLYLWHWPVFVLLRYYFVDGVTPAIWIGALTFVGLAATLSWYAIERPFRSKHMPVRTVVATMGVTAAVLAAVSVATVREDGLPQRFPPEVAAINAAAGNVYRCSLLDTAVVDLIHVCRVNFDSGSATDAEAVLLGNSHALMYAPAWDRVFAAHRTKGLIFQITHGCLPTVQANLDQQCIAEARRYLRSALALPRVRTIIVALTWQHPVLLESNGTNVRNDDNRALTAAIDDLDARIQRSGKHVILVGPIMWPGWDVPTVVGREMAYGLPIKRRLYTTQAQFLRPFDAAIRHFKSLKDITFVPAYEALCTGTRCYYVRDGHSFYADNNHIAAPEVGRFEPLFAAAFKSGKS